MNDSKQDQQQLDAVQQQNDFRGIVQQKLDEITRKREQDYEHMVREAEKKSNRMKSR